MPDTSDSESKTSAVTEKKETKSSEAVTSTPTQANPASPAKKTDDTPESSGDNLAEKNKDKNSEAAKNSGKNVPDWSKGGPTMPDVKGATSGDLMVAMSRFKVALKNLKDEKADQQKQAKNNQSKDANTVKVTDEQIQALEKVVQSNPENITELALTIVEADAQEALSKVSESDLVPDSEKEPMLLLQDKVKDVEENDKNQKAITEAESKAKESPSLSEDKTSESTIQPMQPGK